MLALAVRTAEQFADAFAAIERERPAGLVVLADRLFLHHRARIADFTLHHRLPGVNAHREMVDAGGLMSFGPNYADLHRRAATYVDRILKGARPADLPVEQPSTFELIVNLKTARTLGLTNPPAVLMPAAQVIE